MKKNKKSKSILWTSFKKQDLYSILMDNEFNKKLIEILG